MKFTSLFVLVVSLSLMSQPAKAGSFPVTGTSQLDGSDITDSVTGGPLSLLTQAPSGPNLGAGPLSPGLVNFTLDVPMYSALNGGFGYVTFGNQSTDMVTGSLIFSGTVTVPALPDGTDFTITFPVTMIGNGIAYQDLSGTKGAQIFNLAFKGSGTVTLQGGYARGQFYAIQANASFNGAATVVPEPNSVLLFGTGLAGIAGMLRKRRACILPLR